MSCKQLHKTFTEDGHAWCPFCGRRLIAADDTFVPLYLVILAVAALLGRWLYQ